MTQLPLDQAIPRFKANDERLDVFMNGTDTQDYTASDGSPVPAMRKFLKLRKQDVDNNMASVTAARDAAIAAKNDAQTAATAAAASVTSVTNVIKANALATLADLQAATIPTDLKYVYVHERVAGRGGRAWWERVGVTEPTDVPSRAKVQDHSGQWFKIRRRSDIKITPNALGAYDGFIIEPETRAIFNAFVVKPTSEHLFLIDRTVKRLKRTGAWSYVKWLLAAGKTKQHEQVNLVNPGTGDMTEVSTAIYIEGIGWQAGGTGKLDTGSFNFTDVPGISQDDVHMMVWNLDRSARSNSPVFGTDTAASPSSYIIPERLDDTTFRKRLNSSNATDSTVADAFGMSLSTRLNSTTVRNFRDDDFVDDDTTNTSTGLPTGNIRLLMVSTAAGAGTIPLASIGKSMPDKIVHAYYEIMRTFVNEIKNAVNSGYAVTAAMLDADAAIDPTENTNAMKDFISFISNSRALGYLNSNTYVVNDTIRPKFGVRIKGSRKYSRIMMHSSVGRNKPVLQTGDIDDPAYNIYLTNFSVDFNLARTTLSGGGTVSDAPLGSAVTICYTHHARLRGIDAFDGYKHCIDVSGAVYNRSGSTVHLPYSDQLSEDVRIEDCRAEGSGDDLFTCHMCFNVKFKGCLAMFSRGAYVASSNGFEIDDFSRRVTVEDCEAQFCYSALEIKAHEDARAARTITVRGFRCYRTTNGVILRHINHGGTSEPVSDSAFDLNLSNIEIRNPMEWIASDDGASRCAFRCYAYHGVRVHDVSILQGDAPADYYGTSADVSSSNGVVSIYGDAQDINWHGLHVEGFALSPAAVRITSSATGPIVIMGLTVKNGPLRGLYSSSAARVSLVGYDLQGTGDYGIKSDSAGAFFDGGGFITGYTTKRNIAA